MPSYEVLQNLLANAVPFATHTAVQILEVGDGLGRAGLIQRPEVLNHIQTIHAGAIFTLGEAASGAAMSGIFADNLAMVRPVAAEAAIRYLKAARVSITATASPVDAPADLREQLDSEGKVVFDIEVAITDEDGVDVASMSVTWHVRKT